MIRLLASLNFWESKQLEYWLTDNYSDCKIRCLYDTWSEPEKEELYVIEGHVTKELEYLLKLKYGSKIKGGAKVEHIQSK